MARRTATARFPFAVPAKEQELIRWYFEDYREGPADAVTRLRAGRAGRRLAELGGELSAAVFEASPATRRLWAAVQPRLAEFRVEVVTDVAGATSLPWEAMTDPGTGQPLALGAGAMVRAQPQAALAPVLPEAGAVVRVLVVIARPHETDVRVPVGGPSPGPPAGGQQPGPPARCAAPACLHRADPGAAGRLGRAAALPGACTSTGTACGATPPKGNG